MSERRRRKGPEQNDQEKRDLLRSFVIEQFRAFAAPLDQYQWAWESARWHELVFCLLLRLGQPQIEADIARRLTSTLENLDLLRIEGLVALAGDGGSPDFDHPDLMLMLRVLERFGFTGAQASVAVTTICEAALALQDRHDGKVQRYLRYYGEQMLDELAKHFSFSRMPDEDARHAFTHWLQNVLNMPVKLAEPPVKQLCQQFQVTLDDLVAIADELDLNLALVDDMLASSTASGVGSQSTDVGENWHSQNAESGEET